MAREAFDDQGGLAGILNMVGVNTKEKYFIYRELQEEEEIHMKTYRHSMNVGEIMLPAINLFGLDKKLALAAGLLHDNGKMDIHRDVLYKSGKFNEDDWVEMHKHPKYSYIRTRKNLPLAAEIVLRHHSGQGKESYPPLSDSSGEVLGFASKSCINIIRIADFYEAITSEDRIGDGRYENPTEIRKCIEKAYPRLKREIAIMYANKIFTE